MYYGFSDPALWVAISFLLFLGILGYYKVHALVAKALDERAETIRRRLDEAARLHEEARAVLADYKKKQQEAVAEAEAIKALARKEAEAYAEETRRALAESLARRTQMAEEKIAQAEAQALQDVRNVAAELAVTLAEKLVAEKMTEAHQDKLVDETIDHIRRCLN